MKNEFICIIIFGVEFKAALNNLGDVGTNLYTDAYLHM